MIIEPSLPPEPIERHGLYSYVCERPLCGVSFESDKGMLQPERTYWRHWRERHLPDEKIRS
jgi:hypothetical protein